MEQILFYGIPSGCSFGSIIALEWLGEPYRLCRIEMPAVVQGDAYRRLNPVGETPTLVTRSGAAISESMAILNHLGARGINKGLSFAQGTPEFDQLNQTLAFLNTSLFNGFSPLWYALEHEMDPSDKAALRAYGRGNLVKVLGSLDATIAEKEWLLGDRRTLADAYFAGIARWTDYHDVIDRQNFPKVEGLYQRLQADPAVRFAHAIEAGEDAHSSGGFLGEIRLDDFLGMLSRAA